MLGVQLERGKEKVVQKKQFPYFMHWTPNKRQGFFYFYIPWELPTLRIAAQQNAGFLKRRSYAWMPYTKSSAIDFLVAFINRSVKKLVKTFLKMCCYSLWLNDDSYVTRHRFVASACLSKPCMMRIYEVYNMIHTYSMDIKYTEDNAAFRS